MTGFALGNGIGWTKESGKLMAGGPWIISNYTLE